MAQPKRTSTTNRLTERVRRSVRPTGTLYTHCGIEWTRIGGMWWRASTPLSDGNGNPPFGWGNPYDKGEMEIVDRSTAIYQGGPSAVEFKRTDEDVAPFVCT